MSEKFGLDWKKYPMKRMEKFASIMLWEGERVQKEVDKAKGTPPEPKFR